MPNLITLKKRAQFKVVQAHGAKWITKAFIILAYCNNCDQQCLIKYGIIASRKLGSAVVRNRARRRLREAIYEILPHLGQNGFHYVFIARREILSYDFMDLKKDLRWALKKLHPICTQNDHEAIE